MIGTRDRMGDKGGGRWPEFPKVKHGDLWPTGKRTGGGDR